MNKKNDGGPAFPCKAYTGLMQEGMTLRDHFAGLAMQGRLAGDTRWQELDFKPINGLDVIQNECVLAYRIADAMLAARSAA